MNIQPKVSVVVLNWNGKHFLEKFLPSVLQSSYPNLEIYVADNASTDDSVSFLKQTYPQINIILNKANLGFAAGYNQALSEIDSDYFVLLNSDVEVSRAWIEPVIRLMEADSKIAAAQPKIKDWNKRSLFEYAGAAGGFLDRFGYPFCRGRIFDSREEDFGQYNTATEIFWASGAAFFIKKSAWDFASGFDADFFAHMEEIDLCWRLKNLGYTIAYCPDAEVYHIGGGTLQTDSPFKTYLNFRNNLFMLLKNLKNDKLFQNLFLRFWLDLISLLKFLSEGKFQHVIAINKAHIHFFRDYRKNKRKRITDYSAFTRQGLFEGSIVWQYFAKGKKTFPDICKKEFDSDF